ncbi:dihydrofolate reductase [Clostridium cellulovorans]|uniref:Dihydrofolate reductase n=1 Tax=Clostridium cellulovorans (strain ATCC 35296 / DSM 3052 / OCM 3 / 743B) TaxID=573061 RepID=D9SKY2_CLOC7|nr:dihydrofolate reductase [Clostridium cellulovorans]ADL53554.1 Dihydrofolate reductase [Clostridium cellulovorans 743B]
MLSIIVAKSQNHVIGKDNELIWRISEDLKRFKKLTMGNTIIMGRKTFESLPGILEGRHHIVITRNKDYKVDNENVTVLYDINQVKNCIKEDQENFIIGGEQIYKELLPSTDKIYLTEVDREADGDAYFPILDEKAWIVKNQSEVFCDEKNDLQFKYVDLVRAK